MGPAFCHFVVFYLEEIMNELMNGVNAFINDEEGVTAIEYGLIAALIAVVIIASVTLVGGKLSDIFNYIQSKLVVPT